MSRVIDALGYYEAKALQMQRASLRGDSKAMLSLMQDLAVDGGSIARLAIDHQAAPEPATAVVEAGPNPYDDCLLIHESGSQRIGRIDRKGDCWRLARYQDCKSGTEVIWPLGEVVLAIPVIRFSGQSPAAILAELVGELDGLISESSGVYGLHLNGDPAPWSEILQGGQFEWLCSLDAARRLLAGVSDG